MSQKISIQVNLEDNEVFSEELVRLLKAKTREVVRNNYVEIIGEEAKKEVERLTNAGNVRSLVRAACDEYTKTVIYNVVRQEMDKMDSDSINIQSIIADSIDMRVESMVEHLKASFIANAEKDFKLFTRSFFAEKLSQILDPVKFSVGEENAETQVGDL